MSNLLITLFAYIIDRIFGEFAFIKHPIIFIGELIEFFERKFYKDSVLRGVWLVVFVVGMVGFFAIALQLYLDTLYTPVAIIISSFIASMFVAHHMLRDSVASILSAEDKNAAVAMLVSRDTKDLSESEVYKAAIESYAENLSDGVVAPLFYLLFFSLPGIILYKAINTLDSMVGYRNEKYEKFGKAAAKLDDLLNFIPSRLTAVLIMFVAKQKPLLAFYEDGKKHQSPNAGHPISAMALALGVKLGGDTPYFGMMQKKPHFGNGREDIRKDDVLKALQIL